VPSDFAMIDVKTFRYPRKYLVIRLGLPIALVLLCLTLVVLLVLLSGVGVVVERPLAIWVFCLAALAASILNAHFIFLLTRPISVSHETICALAVIGAQGSCLEWTAIEKIDEIKYVDRLRYQHRTSIVICAKRQRIRFGDDICGFQTLIHELNSEIEGRGIKIQRKTVGQGVSIVRSLDT
jgi:hypothetical protein